MQNPKSMSGKKKKKKKKKKGGSGGEVEGLLNET
jgi:hypothetical protein